MADLAEWEFQRRYGSWDAKSPPEVATALAGAPFTWWIAGGWSLELAGAAPRQHDDIDVAFLVSDARHVRDWLADWHVWEAHSGTLRPLPGDAEPGQDCEQWWLRRDAWSPWVMDLLLTPIEGGDWLYKKDHRVRRPLAEVVRRTGDGVPYQAPEVTLVFKAFLDRPKDIADLKRSWHLLDGAGRSWLRAAIETSNPTSGWLARMAALTGGRLSR